jgi:hypothetical protein
MSLSSVIGLWSNLCQVTITYACQSCLANIRKRTDCKSVDVTQVVYDYTGRCHIKSTDGVSWQDGSCEANKWHVEIGLPTKEAV